jgi:DNA helicase II / ATP-dependent DNA helicase PcrA
MSDIIENITGGLNPPQKEAVMQTSGPLLVFAGAGSGKTRVITNRCAYLIAKENVCAENILAVTFTKKASEEMTERITGMLNELSISTSSKPLIGTFHSISALILRRDGDKLGISTNYSIYDSDDSEKLIKDIMLEQNIDIKQYKPRAISAMISSAKNDYISPKEYGMYHSGFIEDMVADIYPQYQKHLENSNSLDFGDLLFKVVKLFQEFPEVLEKYQEQFKYIMVDEYQDTNKVQYLFVKLLSEKYKNICVVGDDDQGIYGWRGADIKNIISFEKDFPKVKIVKLEQNYRSVQNVIDAAVAVICGNNHRVDKKLWTEKECGSPLTIYQAEDDKAEAQYVVDEILSLRNQGYSLNDIAILYRTNFQSRIFEEAFLRNGIYYKLVGGFRFYERKEIKDILSFMRFINNPKDDLSLLRVINVPPRKMGPTSLALLTNISRELKMPLAFVLLLGYCLINEIDPKDIGNEIDTSRINELVSYKEILEKQSRCLNLFGELYYESFDLDVLAVIETILSKTKYLEWLDDGSEIFESKKENIQELKNLAFSYTEKETTNSLSDFLADIALIEAEQEKIDESKSNVTLMTLHSSKGLEFPAVFMVGMEEGFVPHSRSFVTERELEEERRLCYVGITRAQEKLFLTFAEHRMTMHGIQERTPSRFLSEIPQEICEFYSWRS